MNPDKEKALEARMLGYLLEYPDEQVEYMPQLNPDYFNHFPNLFRTFQRLYEDEDESLDVVTVYSRTEDDISDIIKAVPEPSRIQSIYTELKDATQKRKLARIKAEIEGIIQGDDPVRERMSVLEDKLLEVSENLYSTDSLRLVDEMTGDFLNHLDELHNQKGLTGVPTGLTDLDNSISGYEAGEMIILGARPSTGKSDFMIQSALAAAKAGHGVAMFSLEMNWKNLLKRASSQMTGIQRQKIRRGTYDKHENKRIVQAVGKFKELPLRIDDRSTEIGEISYKLQKLVRQDKCDVAFLDYFGLIEPPDMINGNMQNRMRQVSRELKFLSKSTDVPIVILSQLNRRMLYRETKRPRKSDLRNTGGLEQDADTVILVHRPGVYDDEVDDKVKTEMIVAKQRNGPLTTIKSNYDEKTGRFNDVSH